MPRNINLYESETQDNFGSKGKSLEGEERMSRCELKVWLAWELEEALGGVRYERLTRVDLICKLI